MDLSITVKGKPDFDQARTLPIAGLHLMLLLLRLFGRHTSSSIFRLLTICDKSKLTDSPFLCRESSCGGQRSRKAHSHESIKCH